MESTKAEDAKSAPSFAWKDRVSIAISLFALAISATGSYFTLFREDNSLSAAVLRVGIDDRETTVSVAILNTGNRQVAVTGAGIYLVELDGSEKLRQRLVTTTKRESGPALPLLLEPGRMAIVELSAETDWNSVQAYRQKVEPGEDHTHFTEMGVHIAAFNAAGAQTYGDLDAVRLALVDKKFIGYSLDDSVARFTGKTASPESRR
ncbi:hypothetical protein [Variovorax sp. J22R115]|uniref:hypothetical protein n=1 Tax=Variovorax sp. J22R115 TaxID=3053509 RepID=UPI002575B13D|nr:hypothetical protein [Variovorax sp. J22R115]MDM0053915.1 hypothetical protein [Variovorax sp. J22R115]